MKREFDFTKANSRFWKNVAVDDTEDGCWLWLLSCTGKGYGQLVCDMQHWAAHRLSWELTYGPIPEGLDVLHTCDTPRCVRPSHLFLGDDQANSDDKIKKGRQRYRALYGEDHPARRNPAYLKRGEEHPGAILTWAKVRRMRKLWATKRYRQVDLAHMFSCGRGTVYNIINHKQWKE